MSNLVRSFHEYSNWRTGVASALSRYEAWMDSAELGDAACRQRIEAIRARLANDKLTIAFVAEFSRGKSELINAIFFADYGQRILPSSAGRTTMCPTELMYDDSLPPSIRLLPIETRADAQSTSDLKEQSHAWTVLPLDIASADGMLEAFKQVSLTKRVPVEEARRYGLFDESDADAALTVDAAGTVEISQWRHAIVNFPHPLLKEGLVIIDTPGLNAIGTEPELTLNLIPNAHAVLFVLAADTGVTKSDIDIWRSHIGSAPGRMVVLNKIDSMWDELRSPAEVEAQIEQQAENAAVLLGLDQSQVFPVSAQKGLVAKVNQDAGLLDRSRLPQLESAMSSELIPCKQDIIRSQLLRDIEEINAGRQSLLSARMRNVVEQLVELKSLRGKNQGIILHMMKRIDLEKKEFDSSLVTLQGTRAVFTRLSNEVFTSLGMDNLKGGIRKARDEMSSSRFSTGLRQAVREFFDEVHDSLSVSARKVEEISEMMNAMYRKFSGEHGLALSAPPSFSLDRYVVEIRAIERIYQSQFGTAALLTTPQMVLMQKFFDSIASRVKQAFARANRDVDAWLKMVMAPLESQIYEHKVQLRQRRQSIERIHEATGSLEEKLEALEAMQADLAAKQTTLAMHESGLRNAVMAELAAARMAA
ncbi:Dynamin family protein [Noviherbaspirillum humi]|uniref:Dynamin family protein n=1 Tax=Noviherbaspirillum humi TaxID=1688639 RepID=A0A239CLP5_9BURK|nr:dynamin family protein [Noviherbaspirillum humi]SNS20668.1 Dynamin family protein [Noviherbaspirillum humi]